MTTSLETFGPRRTALSPVPPHGGTLINRMVGGKEAQELHERARTLPRVVLDARALADAELIATGALSPLCGFMGKDDYFSVIDGMRLTNRVLFSIPITLTVPKSMTLREGAEVALSGEDGTLYGTLDVEEIYDVDRKREAREVYRTTDPGHPGVAHLLAGEDVRALGGPIRLFRTPAPRFARHHRTPLDVRAEIARRGWRRTVAFQTRNPIHRAHEYLLRSALETVDGLVVHPLVGETKGDDVPAAVRVRCYEILLERYFPKDRAFLSVFPGSRARIVTRTSCASRSSRIFSRETA
jgi:sulfate adenylyltransferase